MNPANNLTREEARLRARLISPPLSYRIALDLTTGDETFACDTTITFRCTEPGAGTFVDFLPASIGRMELNGRPLPLDAFTGGRIRLRNLQGENQLRVVATCSYQRTGVGLSHFRDPVDGQVYLHSQCETFDAHRVYPCFDQPDLKGAFTFSVRAPTHWEVVSNSPPHSRPAPAAADVKQSALWSFMPTPLMSTYITAVVAGPYHVVRDRHQNIDLGIYCRQSLAPYLDPNEIFEITRQGLDFYERAFGYPYAFGKYDQLFVPEFSAGAMENAGCVTFNERMIFRSRVTEAARERRAGTILHEMAHMWFGDLVTMRWWDDLWLNESFATFMALLSQASATRFTNAWTTFANEVKSSARRQDQLPSTHPIAADIPDVESVHLNFDAITYEKGASVLRQLVAWVGQEPFLKSLGHYFRRREFANADLADFLNDLQTGSGRDLKAWSREWLETAGLNTLRPIFDSRPDGVREAITAFAVRQEAPPEWPTLRSHRLGVGLYDLTEGKLVRRRSIELDVGGPRTEIPSLVGEPIPDLVLINDSDLTYAKIRLDGHSLGTITRHLAAFADPLARALCWSAAWDMVRDGELRARDFLQLVINNIHGESDIGVFQTLLGQGASAIYVYGDPANAASALRTLAERARVGLEQAEPASDLQLAWARSFIASARAPDDVAGVRGLLDGTVPYARLQVDTDLRWSIVHALSVIGAAGEDVISAELARDPTDQGHRHAAGARASQPSAKAKTKAWVSITEDTSLPLAMRRAIMGGFYHPEQRVFLEPYAPRYFATVVPFWQGHGIEVALAFARAMYPRIAIGEETTRMTSQLLDDAATPGPVRRILLEERDLMRRAIRARAVDAASSTA